MLSTPSPQSQHNLTTSTRPCTRSLPACCARCPQMPGVALGASNATDAEICLFLRRSGPGTCPTMRDLCTRSDGQW